MTGVETVEFKSFLEVFADKTGGNPKVLSSEYRDSGKFPIIDQGQRAVAGYSDDESLLAAPREPVIIFGDHTRILKYVDSPFILGADGTKVLVPKIDANVRYLYHYLRFIDIPSAGYSRHFKFLKEVKIPVPPLPEQRRIAAILDKADQLRAQRREALAHLESLTQSIFNDMFGEPVSNDLKWDLEPFESVAPSRLGKMLDKKTQTGLQAFDYLRNANVQWFNIELHDLLQMDFSDREQVEFGLLTGDVLICEGGEPGRAAIWRGERENCFFQKALHRARPIDSKVTSEYIVHLLWHLSHGGGLADHVTSATIAHLTGVKLKRLKIPVPPLELQQTFTKRIAEIERLKEQHRTQLADLNALFTSLQHRAFSGQL